MKLLYVAGAVLLAWMLLCGFYYFWQEAVIFPGSRLSDDHAFQFDRPFEEHAIEVEPGVRLSALWFPAATEPTLGAVLYLHGNAGSLQDWGWHADLFVEAGYDFLAVDYRGYGKSDGRIESEAALHSDIERVWDWLRERHAPSTITVVGYSLGSALATRLVCTPARSAARLVLLAPFTSVRALARRSVPFVPIAILRYPLDTDRLIADCSAPITIFHGARDGTIPVSHSHELVDLTGGRARFVPLPAAGHQDIAQDPIYRAEMRRLLAGDLAGPTP